MNHIYVHPVLYEKLTPITLALLCCTEAVALHSDVSEFVYREYEFLYLLKDTVSEEAYNIIARQLQAKPPTSKASVLPDWLG